MDGTAKILYCNKNADVIVSSAGRISTTQGTADEIYQKSGGNAPEVNHKLIEKVVGSGHYSMLEHITFNLSFDNVSALVEEFIIEFRLASFTVKSRRYVDFSRMGYYRPDFSRYDNGAELAAAYDRHMNRLFDEYAALLQAGVPKEDARFVLPYSFRSNFYCTLNARELIRVVSEMVFGRGAKYPEIKALGSSLKEQLCQLCPFIKIDSAPAPAQDGAAALPECGGGLVDVLFCPDKPEDIVCRAYALAHFEEIAAKTDGEKRAVIHKAIAQSRRRELEQVPVMVRFNRLSLSGITHLVRHRMQSVIIPEFIRACDFGRYVIPESVKPIEGRYRAVFQRSAAVAAELRAAGLSPEDGAYLLLSGLEIPVMTTMNGNELLTFFRLRTCNRAQWEIKNCADELLMKLRAISPVMFSEFGPSCYVTGRCPEGKLACGKERAVKEHYGRGL